MKQFLPQLAPNQQINLSELQYPLIASTKIDGIRMIVKEGKLLTRSLKPQMNKAIQNRFAFIANYSKDMRLIFDGELYSPTLTFPELNGQCRGYENDIVEDLSFYCFDILVQYSNGDYLGAQHSYNERLKILDSHLNNLKSNYFKIVKTKIVYNKKEVEQYFEEVLKQGFEGLILRNPEGIYKFGRATVKENIIYKLKPFITMDAKIIRVEQATEVREGVEKKINELGRSVTSKKQEDRIPIDRACTFIVDYKGNELGVSIGQTEEVREEIWKNRKKYIGKYIEYKGLQIGMKDVPRSCNLIRFRPDKD